MFQLNGTIVTEAWKQLVARSVLYVFCCFCKIQIFWILSSWERYCGSNLLLPSGDNIMAPSADNRPPAHWWTLFNLPLFHFLKPAQSSPSSLSSGLRVKSSGAPKYDYFSAVCVRFTQKKLYIFSRQSTSGTCYLSSWISWVNSLSFRLLDPNLNCCNFLNL